MATETGYVSRYLTHFVGRGKSRNEQYELLKRILMGHWLTHPPHVEQPSLGLTIHKDRVFSDNDMFIPDMLCFCDIPEAQLGIHTRKYSQFGIAFDKAYLIAKGANPVMYVARHSTVQRKKREFRADGVPRTTVTPEEYEALKVQQVEAEKFEDAQRGALFDEHARELLALWYAKEEFEGGKAGNEVATLLKRDKQMWTFFLNHLLGFVKFFDDTLVPEHPDNFYMEREWRRLGNLNFQSEDVTQILVPPDFVDRAREELPEYAGKVRGLPI